MALVRVAQYSSVPGPVTDYQAQNAHLQAFTNQLLTQQFILDSGIDQPVIKQGCYVSHGGSLYVADADTSITGSPSDGSVYIRVSGTTSLTVEFVNNISGYAWNPVYTALTSGSYTLLPYLIVKASSVWTRYNFNPNNQSFGAIIGASLAVTGNITVGGTVDGHDIDSELDTLNGRVNQGVKTTDSPTFVRVNTGYGANHVYKISEETVNFGTVQWTDKTMSISAMDIKEIRTVNTTGSVRGDVDDPGRLYLKLPAGGTYLVVGDDIGGVFSGGTTVAQVQDNTNTPVTFNVGLIVRRIS